MLPTRIAALSAAAILGLGAANAPAPAEAQQLFSQTPADIIAIARNFGTADFGEPDADGRPFIVAESDEGLFYNILLYGCNQAQVCEAAQLFATFEPDQNSSLALVNQWNNDRLYGAAYIGDDGTIFISYVINMDFGITRDNFYDSMDIWTIALDDFADHVYPPLTSGKTGP